MVQSTQTQDGPLEKAVDLSEDLNQQTHMEPGELHSQESEGAFGKVEGAEAEGQRGVNHSQGNAENSQEAFGDVVPLEKHQIPV